MSMTEANRLEASAKFEAAHRRLWTWLAEHPKKEKWDWPEWRDNGGAVPVVDDSRCFACYAGGNNCSYCPLDSKAATNASGIYVLGQCLSGLYCEWSREIVSEKRAELARIIADLPWNPDKVTMPWPESVDISGAV